MADTTYIYDNIEVKKTGRIAQKKQKQKTTRSNRTPIIEDVVFEITPSDPENGHWKKWVKDTDLYIIKSGTTI